VVIARVPVSSSCTWIWRVLRMINRVIEIRYKRARTCFENVGLLGTSPITLLQGTFTRRLYKAVSRRVLRHISFSFSPVRFTNTVSPLVPGSGRWKSVMVLKVWKSCLWKSVNVPVEATEKRWNKRTPQTAHEIMPL